MIPKYISMIIVFNSYRKMCDPVQSTNKLFSLMVNINSRNKSIHRINLLIQTTWFEHQTKPHTTNHRRMKIYFPTTREGNVFRSVCLFKGGYDVTSVWYHVPLGVWCHFLSGGVSIKGERMETPLVLKSSGSHCSSRYAPYWNAFLLVQTFTVYSQETIRRLVI